MNGIYELPHWVAQPYIRPPSVPVTNDKSVTGVTSDDKKQPVSDKDGVVTEKPTETKKRNKQEKENRKSARLLCKTCPNVRSKTNDFCKVCLRNQAADQDSVELKGQEVAQEQ